jgi:soluble lytic murein transglycosylase-like protein
MRDSLCSSLQIIDDRFSVDVPGFGGFQDDDGYAAWAACNGGPGNAQRWKEVSNGDTDLFVENISLGETRLYIDRLRENLAWYQRLYGR